MCEQNFANFKGEINPFYNKAALVFNQLERAVNKVDPLLFEEYFDQQVDEFVYTQYNLNTLTTRPSTSRLADFPDSWSFRLVKLFEKPEY